MNTLFVVVLSVLICGAVCAQDAMVWVASPWTHVLKSTEPGAGRSVEIQAAKNEYEPFRIIVRAGEAALADVNVAASPLTGPGGFLFSHGQYQRQSMRRSWN